MQTFIKRLGVKDFPLFANLVFSVSIKMDDKQTGLATFKVELQPVDVDQWKEAGVEPPQINETKDFSINSGQEDAIIKFIEKFTDEAQGNMNHLEIPAIQGKMFLESLTGLFKAKDFKAL